MKFTVKEILPRIYLCDFSTRYDLSMSFIRIQEFSEDPKFMGRVFTLEKYMLWYSKKEGEGSFSYPADFNGFNIPGESYREWLTKYRGKFRPMEKELISRIKTPKRGSFYIIGVHREISNLGREQTINHELAHAFYHLIPEYAKGARKLVRALSDSMRKKYFKILKKEGYHNNMWFDELQAYASTGSCLEIKWRPEFARHFDTFLRNISSKR